MWICVTVHRLLSRKVFWHVYAKIPGHTGQNAITEGDLEYILIRLLFRRHFPKLSKQWFWGCWFLLVSICEMMQIITKNSLTNRCA